MDIIFCVFYSFDKFSETDIPPKDAYKSDLTGEEISDVDYLFAQEMWRNLEISDLGELHDLYLAIDTTLLSDVFERFDFNSKWELKSIYFLI